VARHVVVAHPGERGTGPARKALAARRDPVVSTLAWLVVIAAIFATGSAALALRAAGRKAGVLAQLPEPAPDEPEEAP
jgi:hypothetical protein